MNFWDQFEEIQTTPPKALKNEEVMTPDVPNMSVGIEKPSEDFWSQFQEMKQPPSKMEEYLDTGKRLGTRVAEGILGLPGDIESFVRPVAKKLLPGVSRKMIFPSSEELRDIGKEKFQGELEPKGPIEQDVGEVLQDYVFTPGGPIKKALITGAGYGMKKALDLFGADATTSSIGKAVTTFGLSFLGKKNVRNFIDKQYDNARKALNPHDLLDVVPIERKLNSLKTGLQKGITTASDEAAISQIDKILSTISKNKGHLSVEEGDIIFHKLNKIWKETNDPEIRKHISDIKKPITQSLESYGKKSNPKYLEAFNTANSAYAGWAENRKAVQAMNKWKKTAIIGGVPALVAEFYFHGPELTGATLAAIAAGYGAGSGHDLFKRITSNPTLFKYYTKAGMAAASENLPQFVHNANKLDKALKEGSGSRIGDIIRGHPKLE
jgi:hypothetical protein